MINKSNQRGNYKRIPYEYKQGDQVLIRKGSENKYETPFTGPYIILMVNDNGTVKLQKGAVTDSINIRRLTPYNRPSNIDHGGECNAPLLRRSQRRTNRQTSSL